MSEKRDKNSKITSSQQGRNAKIPLQSPAEMTLQRSEFFSGPIPPPSLLAKYNEVIPGGAERILKMAERQSAHRESLEAQVVAANVQSQRYGSIMAFIIALVAILGGIFLIYEGKSVFGLATILSYLAGILYVFVANKQSQRKERAEKSIALEERRRSR